MKDDRWAATMAAELVALWLTKGGRMPDEALEMEEEIEEIEEAFARRFGRPRAKVLLAAIYKSMNV